MHGQNPVLTRLLDEISGITQMHGEKLIHNLVRTAFVAVGKQLPHELMTFAKHGSSRHVAIAILGAEATPDMANPANVTSSNDCTTPLCMPAKLEGAGPRTVCGLLV